MSESLPVVYLARHGETAWCLSGRASRGCRVTRRSLAKISSPSRPCSKTQERKRVGRRNTVTVADFVFAYTLDWAKRGAAARASHSFRYGSDVRPPLRIAWHSPSAHDKLG